MPVEYAESLERVTALVVNYDSGPWLERCLRTLRSRSEKLPPVVVLDNSSTDDSALAAAEFPNLILRRARVNLGFARGVNRAAAVARTEFILIINPDCLLVPDALIRLIAELDAHPGAGLVSGRLFDMRGYEQRASRRRLPTPRRVLAEVLPFMHGDGVDLTHLPPPENPSEVEAVSGACMLVRTEAFRSVRGMDPGFPMHFEDLDFMTRLRAAGWSVRLVPEVAISHAGGVSSRHRPVGVALDKHRGLWRYLSKHCRAEWPAWSRPFWWLAIWTHALFRVALAGIARR